MDWDSLRYLLAVARAGSVADAAKQLGVSHSTVYRRVNAFEAEHQIEVFERLPDGYRLTAAGEALIARTAAVADAVDDVARSLQVGGEVSGSVVIAAPEAVGLAICPQLGRLIERFERLTMSWHLDAAEANLHRREADIAIRATRSPPETLVGRRLADVAFAIYGARGYLERHPGGLDDARWVVFDGPLAASPQGRWEAANVAAERVALRVDRRVMLDEAVRAGVGVGVLPRAVGDTSPSLVKLGDDLAQLALPLWVLTHPDLRDVPRVRAVMDFVVEILGAHRDRLEGDEAD